MKTAVSVTRSTPRLRGWMPNAANPTPKPPALTAFERGLQRGREREREHLAPIIEEMASDIEAQAAADYPDWARAKYPGEIASTSATWNCRAGLALPSAIREATA